MPRINVSEFIEAIRSSGKDEKKIHNNEVIDWTALKKGDVVRSVQGYGPYFENSKGEKTYQGNYGIFKVDEVHKEGFYAHEYSSRGRKLDFGGRRFLYMGESRRVDIIYRQPHKLIKVLK